MSALNTELYFSNSIKFLIQLIIVAKKERLGWIFTNRFILQPHLEYLDGGWDVFESPTVAVWRASTLLFSGSRAGSAAQLRPLNWLSPAPSPVVPAHLSSIGSSSAQLTRFLTPSSSDRQLTTWSSVLVVGSELYYLPSALCLRFSCVSALKPG